MMKINSSYKIENILFISIAVIWLIIVIFPITMSVNATFSTPNRNLTTALYPNSLTDGLDNISKALIQANMLNATVKSLIITSTTILGMLFICSLASYELSLFKFPGRDIIFLIILSSMMMPLILYIIPLYRFVFHLRWMDTLQGAAIPPMASALAIFIIKQFLETLPRDIIEAAEIDGASHFGIFFRIIIPLSSTAMLTVVVIMFVNIWGAFLWPTLVTGAKWKPVSVTIAGLLSSVSWVESQVRIAALLLSAIPPLVIYLFSNKYIIESIATTGMKS